MGSVTPFRSSPILMQHESLPSLRTTPLYSRFLRKILSQSSPRRCDLYIQRTQTDTTHLLIHPAVQNCARQAANRPNEPSREEISSIGRNGTAYLDLQQVVLPRGEMQHRSLSDGFSFARWSLGRSNVSSVSLFHCASPTSSSSSFWQQTSSRRALSYNCRLHAFPRSVIHRFLLPPIASVAPENQGASSGGHSRLESVRLKDELAVMVAVVHGEYLGGLLQSLVSVVVALAMTVGVQGAPSSRDTFEDVPQTLSGGDKGQRIQRPKSAKAESCTRKCVSTCIRGGAGGPGEGPLNVRRPLVVFKEGFRSRNYCLIECSEICNLIGDGDDGP